VTSVEEVSLKKARAGDVMKKKKRRGKKGKRKITFSEILQISASICGIIATISGLYQCAIGR
jgi:hypothetical protein